MNNKCPNCGKYMESQIELTSSGWRLVWKCLCGYCTGNETIRYSDKTEPQYEHLVRYSDSTITYTY